MTCSTESPASDGKSARPVSSTTISLSIPALCALIEQASERGVARALAEQRDEYMTSRQAARYLYGCEGKLDAFRRLRQRYPEIDRLSIGAGRVRRWKRADLDKFLATTSHRRRRTEKTA